VSLELHVSRRAAVEIERIVKWWAENRPAAPGAVRKDLNAALDILLEQPDIGSKVEEASSPDVRRFHVDRIRYWSSTEYAAGDLKSYPSGTPVEAAVPPSNKMTLTKTL